MTTSNPSDILSIENLSIGYGSRTVASHLSATLRAGCLTCLVGRNGVGKSTLLKTLSGFLPPLSGTVCISGRDASALTGRERARLVSVVLTGRPEVRMLTVEETVALGRTPYTNLWGRLTAHDTAVIDSSIAAVGIAPLRHRNIGSLSDGECQKVMIAKALAQTTPLVLLDEPTAFLDYPSKAETMRLLKSITMAGGAHGSRVTALLSTHDMEMALRLADRLWVMTSESTLCTGTPGELHEVLKKEKLVF